MFTASFNLAPFNRPATTELYFTVDVESLSEVSARLNVEAVMSATLESAVELSASLTREIYFASTVDVLTESIAVLTRELYLAAGIEVKSEFIAEITRYHVQALTYSGGLAPGDRLVIDTRNQTVTLNGVNVLHLFDGDFIDIVNGANAIKYTDTESTRNILTRITHRDRYLY